MNRIAADNTETFKCPNCGTKVLKNTGYCVKCKEKVKEASEVRVARELVRIAKELSADY